METIHYILDNWDYLLTLTLQHLWLVALSSAMNLNVGLAYAYNSDPGLGRKKGDSLLTTGVSVKFD